MLTTHVGIKFAPTQTEVVSAICDYAAEAYERLSPGMLNLLRYCLNEDARSVRIFSQNDRLFVRFTLISALLGMHMELEPEESGPFISVVSKALAFLAPYCY